MKIKPTAKEIRHIIGNRRMVELDKKFARFIIPCLIVFVPTLILLLVATGMFQTSDLVTYDLGNEQILITESRLPLELNGVELKPIEELSPTPTGLTAIIVTLLVIVSLTGVALFSLLGYQYYAGWKAQAVLLEEYLETEQEK